jgi:Set1/Ash2 histone methyltransferase complex subunit ASH2
MVEVGTRAGCVVMRYVRALPRRLCLELGRRVPQSQLSLSLDDCCLASEHGCGYRMARGSMGTFYGSHYYEVHFDSSTPEGAARLGVCSLKADLDAPCGYDSYSFALATRTGHVLTRSRARPYTLRALRPGDTLGVMLHLPPRDQPPLKVLQSEVVSKGVILEEEDEEERPHPGASLEYYLNGEPLGVAFQGLWHVTYYPAISVYSGGRATVNFGPTFKYAPQTLVPYQPWCEVVDDYPQPQTPSTAPSASTTVVPMVNQNVGSVSSSDAQVDPEAMSLAS